MTSETTPTAKEAPTMSSFFIPTTTNRGFARVGQRIESAGCIDLVAQVSLTAYRLVDDLTGEDRWVSFDRVHGRPTPAQPLVTFG